MSRRDSRTEYETFDAECIAETAAAILVKIEEEQHWVPKSLLHPEDNEVAAKGDVGTLVVPLWFVEKEGWA